VEGDTADDSLRQSCIIYKFLCFSDSWTLCIHCWAFDRSTCNVSTSTVIGTGTNAPCWLLQKTGCHYDLQTYYFTNQVIEMWNVLLNHIVYVESTKRCSISLNNPWRNQEVIYDFQSDIEGVRSRSKIVL